MKNRDMAKYLEQVKRDRKARFDFQGKNRIAELEDYGRRSRKAGKILDGLWEKGAAAAGIDTKRLERLHNQDNQAAKKFREKQMAGIKSYAMRRAEEKKRLGDKVHRTLRRKFKEKFHNPILASWLATDINVLERLYLDASITAPTVSVAFLSNMLKTQISARGDNRSDAQATMWITYDFVLPESPTTGVAEAVAYVRFDGTYSLYTEGKCSHSSKSLCSVRANVYASQPITGSEVLEFSSGGNTIVDEEISSGCSANSKSGVLDDERLRLVTTPDVPIVAGYPVVVSVLIVIDCYASEDASSELDADNEFGFWVPCAGVKFSD